MTRCAACAPCSTRAGARPTSRSTAVSTAAMPRASSRRGPTFWCRGRPFSRQGRPRPPRPPCAPPPAAPEPLEPVPSSETHLRVRYAETDRMGVVYYANYLVWFEVARADLMRSLGWTYREMEETGITLPVIEARCDYK